MSAAPSKSFQQPPDTNGPNQVRIYDLRHTCITLWIKAGVDVHVASRLAGHATAAFTLTVYAKALPSQQLEAAEKMDRLCGTA